MRALTEVLSAAVTAEILAANARKLAVNAGARLVILDGCFVGERKSHGAGFAPPAAGSNHAGILKNPRAGVQRLLAEAPRHPANPLERPAEALIGHGTLLLRAGNAMFFANKAARRPAITGSPGATALQRSAKSLSMAAQPVIVPVSALEAARKTQFCCCIKRNRLENSERPHESLTAHRVRRSSCHDGRDAQATN